VTTDGLIPDDLLYTASHEWLRSDPANPGEATSGITDFAQDQLGDVVYVDLPDAGSPLSAGATCGEIESTKTVAEFYAAVSGEVIAANDELIEQPELVNDAPYGDGWLIRLRLADDAELDGMLDAAAYRAQLAAD
jgi:glycine cleavage system H protein